MSHFGGHFQIRGHVWTLVSSLAENTHFSLSIQQFSLHNIPFCVPDLLVNTSSKLNTAFKMDTASKLISQSELATGLGSALLNHKTESNFVFNCTLNGISSYQSVSVVLERHVN